MSDTLAWGRRYLMCPPDFFTIAYEINPWMHADVTVDRDLAALQWHTLRHALRTAGAAIEVLDPVDGLPDLVFTANAGVVDGRRFVPSRFRNPERASETPIDCAWFERHGYELHPMLPGVVHEGAGDALPFTDRSGTPVLVSGYRTRSDVQSHVSLSRVLGVPVRPVELVDRRLYHLDLTFCPLDKRRAIVVPGAWDRYGARMMDELVPEPLELSVDEALGFVANSLVVGSVVVMPHCPPRVGWQLERWGFTAVEVDVSEFHKAGGACRCLTLALDVRLT
ncbi:MAG: amidinotransferase [Actinobacteria bacterium]|nr:amidinotransferase [Actinomycetota bacterium]